jgi:hypothetical protein
MEHLHWNLRTAAAFAGLLLASAAAAAQQNPLARPAAPSAASLNGRWNGVNLERRSACTQPQNEGSRGTYAQFDISADTGGGLTITQSGITGLNCTYAARYLAIGRSLALEGTYACSDGKQGTFAGGDVQLHGLSLDVRLPIRLTASETCQVDALLSMARLPG